VCQKYFMPEAVEIDFAMDGEEGFDFENFEAKDESESEDVAEQKKEEEHANDNQLSDNEHLGTTEIPIDPAILNAMERGGNAGDWIVDSRTGGFHWDGENILNPEGNVWINSDSEMHEQILGAFQNSEASVFLPDYEERKDEGDFIRVELYVTQLHLDKETSEVSYSIVKNETWIPKEDPEHGSRASDRNTESYTAGWGDEIFDEVPANDNSEDARLVAYAAEYAEAFEKESAEISDVVEGKSEHVVAVVGAVEVPPLQIVEPAPVVQTEDKVEASHALSDHATEIAAPFDLTWEDALPIDSLLDVPSFVETVAQNEISHTERRELAPINAPPETILQSSLDIPAINALLQNERDVVLGAILGEMFDAGPLEMLPEEAVSESVSEHVDAIAHVIEPLPSIASIDMELIAPEEPITLTIQEHELVSGARASVTQISSQQEEASSEVVASFSEMINEIQAERAHEMALVTEAATESTEETLVVSPIEIIASPIDVPTTLNESSSMLFEANDNLEARRESAEYALSSLETSKSENENRAEAIFRALGIPLFSEVSGLRSTTVERFNPSRGASHAVHALPAHTKSWERDGIRMKKAA